MPARGNVPRRGTSPRVRPAGNPRRRFGLRDARIRSKLGVILIIPILAIVSLTTVRLLDSGRRAACSATTALKLAGCQ